MFRPLLLVAAALATPAFAAEMNFPVGGFDRIALGGSPDVTVTTGRAVAVHASGDQAALDRLDIRVEDGVLKIGTKRGSDWSWRNYGHIRIAVSVPMVRGVDIGGSGTVSIDRVKAPGFDAQIGGSGAIKVAALDTGKAQVGISGSGSIDAAGRCASAQVSVAGSGNARLAGLACETLAVNVAGSGDVDARASRSAAVSVMGSGDVRVAGGARCSISKHGSGSVDCSA